MSFRNKIKMRMGFAISFMVLGAVLIVCGILLSWENTIYSGIGAALFVVGAARLRRNVILIKSDNKMQAQEIRETDERNVYIVNKARSIAFYVYFLIGCVAVVALEIFSQSLIAQTVFACLVLLTVIYWIVYWIIRKSS